MRAVVLDRICPICEGAGDSSHCPCGGRGLLPASEAAGWEEHGIALAVVPPPPTEMRRPCADCAFKVDSPEYDSGQILQIADSDAPFFCHQGMHTTVDGRHIPRQSGPGEVPIGHPVCAGWAAARRRAEARAR